MKLLLGNILVTGGLGFIGSHFIHQILPKELGASSIINVDFEGYGSNSNNLKDISDTRYRYVNTNINDGSILEALAKSTEINMIVNFAAETHVDRSISKPTQFVNSNINGVISLLELCRKHDIHLFIQISTDEVYGDAKGLGHLNEDSALLPNSPYSASKAAADLLTRAYTKTYGLNSIITRCSNNFGPNQFPEKLIPKTIIRALIGLPISIYGDGSQIREWIYVNDHVNAILKIITKGRRGEIYNITSSNEMSNINVVNKIINLLHKIVGKEVKVKHVRDRPAHDRRYSLNASKIKKDVGWRPAFTFDHALELTVKWYVKNRWWWTPLLKDSVLDEEPWEIDWKVKRV